MLLDKKRILKCSNNLIGITHPGECKIGHKRRCPIVMIEPPVCLSDGIKLETHFLGMGTYIGEHTVVKQTEFIGRFSFIGEYCYIGAANQEFLNISNSMIFKDNSIAWYEHFLKINYPYGNKKRKKTRVGNDVWIGDNVTVFQGVNIGDGAAILSGTTVTCDIPPYAVISGNPGTICGYRFEREVIAELLQLRWWKFGIDLFKNIKLNDISIEEIVAYQKEHIEDLEEIKYGFRSFKFAWSSNKWIVSYEEGGKKAIYQMVPEES